MSNPEKALCLKLGQFDGKYIVASWAYIKAESAWLLSLFNGEYVMRRVYLESAEACYEYAIKIEARMYRAFYDMAEDVPVDVAAGDTYSSPTFNAIFESDAFVVDKPVHPTVDSSAIFVGTPETCMMWNGRHVSATIYYEAKDKYIAAIECNGSVKLVTGKDFIELRDIAFWVDRCIDRYVADSAIVILDNDDDRPDYDRPVVDENGDPWF